MKEENGNSKARPKRSMILRHREITLKDGRYMIFYTFDEDTVKPAEVSEEPKPESRTEELQQKNV
jgi:hypothetical protein